jgi:carbon-monoxide dehydrogenase medium subunit
MIPAEFDYEAPDSLQEAIELLSRRGGDDPKLLAGGHSLIPLMKLRLSTPGLLVDLRRVPGLHGAQRKDGHWRVGALTSHAELARSPLALAAAVAGSIADQQVRNCGTIGGSLAHGDPASDLPAMLLACDGSVTLQGPSGQRTVAAGDLFRDYLETAVAADEVLTEVRLPGLEGWGFAHRKFHRRSEDWGVVGVTALVKRSGDRCEEVRVAMSNMGSVPLRAVAAEDALRGSSLTAEAVDAAAGAAAEGTDPPADLNASSDYKRHLARVLCARALKEAAGLT